MGEIPSTMDLIMERTKGMSLSQEEKEAFRREEMQKKAKGFKLRLLEDPAWSDEIAAAVEGVPRESRDLLWSLIWETMVDGLIEDEQPFKYLDIMEKLPQAKEKHSLLKTVREELQAALKDRGKERKKVVSREKKKLSSFGISGSAVVPKIPASSGGDTAVRAAAESFRERLLENTRAA